MQFVTDFADQAVMLPVALAVAVGLAAAGWWRGLGAWLAAVIGTLGTMAVLKYVCFNCSRYFAGLGIHSPSGHTAASTAIYGGLLLLLLRGRMARPALAAIPLLIATVIATTRISLHAHDLIEVVIGACVGMAGVAVLVPLAGTRPQRRYWPAVALVMLTVAVFHGDHLAAEGQIRSTPLLSWLPLPDSCRI